MLLKTITTQSPESGTTIGRDHILFREILKKEATVMSKSQDVKKDEKKKPAKTAKEKKQAKQEKKRGG